MLLAGATVTHAPKNITIDKIATTVTRNELVVGLEIRDNLGKPLYSFEKVSGAKSVTRSGTVYHRGEVVGGITFSLSNAFYEKNRRHF